MAKDEGQDGQDIHDVQDTHDAHQTASCSGRNTPDPTSPLSLVLEAGASASAEAAAGISNDGHNQSAASSRSPPSADSLPSPSTSDCGDKPTTSTRKEESPFSFRHFLKRDIALGPMQSARPTLDLEGTGAKPKVFSGSSRPSRQSPGGPERRRDLGERSSRDEARRRDGDFDPDPIPPREERSGAPSLPDFVRDHVGLERARLGAGSADFENLPDFAVDLNEDPDAEPDRRRRGSGGIAGDRASSSADSRSFDGRPDASERSFPLDLPDRLSLDLTDSLNRSRRPDGGHRNAFPLDLPDSADAAGGESSRLPDFLPSRVGAGNATGDFAEERRFRLAAERELRNALQTSATLRRELSEARASEAAARRNASEAVANAAKIARQLHGGGRISASPAGASMEDDTRRGSESDVIARLRLQVCQLKEQLARKQAEIDQLKNNHRNVSQSLTQATNSAETSLRELLSGLDQLRGLASSLDPP